MSETAVTRTNGTTASKRASTRDRIVRAAAELLAKGGRGAVSTRAVAAAAGVQAPTIYRQFGDMQGLLDEVASFGFSAYLRDKTARGREEDPVEDLRRGWDLHVEFGLANPAFYTLMYGDPVPGTGSTAALEATEILRGLVRRVAEAGRLRVGEERAAQMIHAAGSGVTLTLIGVEPEERDPALSDTAREAVIAAITTDGPAPATPGPVSAAISLRAVLPQTSALSAHERALLREWLDRIAGC